MKPSKQSLLSAEICRLAPVVPVLVIDDLAHAKPLAEALVQGGLPALEVTLRTACALDAIRAMAEVPGGVVGAGTLLTPADVKAAKAAGANSASLPARPSACWTPVRNMNCRCCRGLPPLRKSWRCWSWAIRCRNSSPPSRLAGRLISIHRLADPAGVVLPDRGISLKNARDYLGLKNIPLSAGSWVAPKEAMTKGDWAAITTLAAEAAQLR